MIKKDTTTIKNLKFEDDVGINRRGALGAREARREKRQCRAILTAIWGLLEQLGIGSKLLKWELTRELDPQAKRSLSKAVIELCRAQKRVGISAVRWAEQNRLLGWNWAELKRVVRALDEEGERSLKLRQALREQLQNQIENAPRSYADIISDAPTREQIQQIVKGVEKAQRAQLTRLQTELLRSAQSPMQLPKQSALLRKKSKNAGGPIPSDSGSSASLESRLTLEIERAKSTLGDMTGKITRYLLLFPGVKATDKTKLAKRANSRVAPGYSEPKRRGRPPAIKWRGDRADALCGAQHRWEMAYEEIKQLLRSSRRIQTRKKGV